MTASTYKHIVIFASGSGSNAQCLMDYFNQHPRIRIVALFSNNPEAYALERAKKCNIPAHFFSRDDLRYGAVLEQVQAYHPDLIVLAGFLWLVPASFVREFPNRIINIHPALLPKFGGKGMHGANVHAAVINGQEKESGITIHYVNEHYDQGAAIYQHTCPVEPGDTPETLAQRVLALEHEYLPRVVEEVLLAQQHD